MAFFGDLVVKLGANINPFTSALKKAQSMTRTFREALTDMRTTAGVFARLAASIRAVNVQMDRLVHLSRNALAATQGLARVEHQQAMNRMRQLREMANAQGRRTSMLDIAGGIGIASVAQSGVSMVKDMAVGVVNLAANAETSRIQFEVLTGSAERGAELFKEIETFAGRTSFNLESAADATKQLLASGIADSDVMDTMQLLGDLAMGDANKLGFLAKAFTDVKNKGKLQGQELRQFAENGVGLVEALSKQMGVGKAEVLKLSEEGKISFRQMKDALLGLTGEGGRFHNMMARINKTFTGQWNSLIESIQKVGREIGAAVLPKLTEIVGEMNKFAHGFAEMPDKWKFAGDLLTAAFDVAFETIKANWSTMLSDMTRSLKSFMTDRVKWELNPKNWFNADESTKPAWFGGVAQRGGGLEGAQQRLAGLMAQVIPPENPAGIAAMKALPKLGGRPEAKGSGDFAGLFGRLADAISSPLAAMKMEGQGIFDRANLNLNWGAGLLERMFTAERPEEEKKKAMEPRLAGAMQRGSAEAFSTIVQAMIREKQDPNVKATEKQTKEIVAALEKNKPPAFAILEAFGL